MHGYVYHTDPKECSASSTYCPQSLQYQHETVEEIAKLPLMQAYPLGTPSLSMHEYPGWQVPDWPQPNILCA